MGLFIASTELSKKNPAKFSDTCSVRADGLCIGCPKLVGSKKAANSNMQEFFCSTLYILSSLIALYKGRKEEEGTKCDDGNDGGF